MSQAATDSLSARSADALRRNAIIATLIMTLAATLAWMLTPTHRLADKNPIHLETMIPTAFGDWRVDANAFAGVVNPQQTELINRLYSQTLSRTYVNTRTGDRIMLSIAYGEDQRDGMQLHYPEVCYPAQGFEVRSNQVGELSISDVSLPVRRLETVLNNRRFEPVTYWTLLGDQVFLGGVAKKMAELKYGLNGTVADGLLFRVSSISRESQSAFEVQEMFVKELILGVSPSTKYRIVGHE